MIGTTINPALQLIQTAGVSGFVSRVLLGEIPPDQTIAAFGAVGTAIDTYVGEYPPNDAPTALRSSIRKLPKEGIKPKMREDILGLLITHQDVVEKAVRVHAINAEAPFNLGTQWRWIPPGEFKMGSADDDPHAYDNEKPLRSVMVGGFYMLAHPATNAEFRAFLEATGREEAHELQQSGWYAQFAGDDKPVPYFDREEAQVYSEWFAEQIAQRIGHSVIGRLPTEAEWERAAKGPDGNEFISPATREQAHFSAETTREVNHSDVHFNGFGVGDLIGNVWEWTSSLLEEGSFTPVIRGGCSLFDNPRYFRAAVRYYPSPHFCHFLIGFRPVMVPEDLKSDLDFYPSYNETRRR